MTASTSTSLSKAAGEVSIQLQVRDGAVHASFQTSSSELREALQQGWSQLSGSQRATRPATGASRLQEPETGSFTAGHQNFGERRQEPPQEQSQTPRPAIF